jgi:ABC-type bacteriocin/lantibiotic exporter with double-glycine peptidase domain
MLLDLLQNNAWRRFELVETRKNDVRSEIRWRLIWYFNRILNNGWIEQLYNNYKIRRTDWFDLKYKQNNLDRIYELAKNLLNNSLQAVSSMTAAWLVLQKVIQIGTFVVFDLYVSRIKGFLQNIGTIFRTVVELRFELFRIDFLLNIKPKLDYTDIQKFEVKTIEKIELKNLNFTYPKFFTEEIEYFKQMQQRLGLLELSSSDNDKKQNVSFKKENEGNRFFALLRTTSDRFKSKVGTITAKFWAIVSQKSINRWEKEQLKKEFEEIDKIFQKANQNQPILKNLSLEFKKGQIYALVGYNGAGKTTLTKLLKRAIDPSSGQILIDGLDLKKIDPLGWKSYISGLEQENFIWDSFSIRENLNLGNSDGLEFSDEQLWDALEKVGLKSAINDLDVVYSEGIELSGGQNQLLEIARIYLQKKPIVILDEGTNQLDALKESQILNVLQEIKQNSIVIFITHRMTTCSRCDQIFVLDEGKLVNTGTHQSLLEDTNSNLYQKFWKIQVEGEAV